jgi:hypothetical protein
MSRSFPKSYRLAFHFIRDLEEFLTWAEGQPDIWQRFEGHLKEKAVPVGVKIDSRGILDILDAAGGTDAFRPKN